MNLCFTAMNGQNFNLKWLLWYAQKRKIHTKKKTERERKKSNTDETTSLNCNHQLCISPEYYTHFVWNTKKGDTPLLNASSAASATAYKNELISYLYNGLTSYRLYQRENPLIKKHVHTHAHAATVAALPKQTISIKLNRKQEKHYHHPE